jgi:rhamnose utilization protein RhaD (predicted bifunctional aldolase and dehydrogenase)
MNDIIPLLERERMSDSDMVDYLAHCFFEPGRPRPSIESLLHGFLPFNHIDHTHADASNFFACAAEGEQLARDCFGDDLIWIPYRRPGFGLAREVSLAVHTRPGAKLIILAKHGLITWGDTDDACYAATLATITKARDYVKERSSQFSPGGRLQGVFGGPRVTTLPASERHSIAAQVAPVLRGLVSVEKHQVLRYEDSEDVLTFVGSQDAPLLTRIGAACPDHLVHTKPWPLLIDWTQGQEVSTFLGSLRDSVAAYVEKYRHYLEENARQNLDPDAAMPVYRNAAMASDPHPRVILNSQCGHVYYWQRCYDG